MFALEAKADGVDNGRRNGIFTFRGVLDTKLKTCRFESCPFRNYVVFCNIKYHMYICVYENG